MQWSNRFNVSGIDRSKTAKKGALIIGIELLLQVVILTVSSITAYNLPLSYNILLGAVVSFVILIAWDCIHDRQVEKLDYRVSKLEEQQKILEEKVEQMTNKGS
jgi:methyl coenzyme M reductase subunit D